MESLLEIPEIEVVCVCNESGLHGETIARIAKAGKNILCEKPLETTIEKIDQIAEVVKSSGIKLGCVFQNRENPEYIKLKNYFDSGILGKVLLCQATINWYRPPNYYKNSWRGTLSMDGGAALINQGIHTIDLMLDLMGEVSEVSGFIDTLYHDIEGEDLGVASFKFKSGALGTLSFDSAGGGLEGVTAYDDLLPTAYEEVWNGVGSGTSYNAGAASNDTIGYSNSFGAVGISLASSKGGTRATADGGNLSLIHI